MVSLQPGASARSVLASVETVSMTVAPIAVSFLMRRRPLRSTLFPFTTLFRSAGVRGGALDGGARAAAARAALGCRPGHRPAARARARRDQDRKSTRLNSSHSQNSYAVFCLKKKNYEILFGIEDGEFAAGGVGQIGLGVCRNGVNDRGADSGFFFNETATPAIYTLSLHDALPICWCSWWRPRWRSSSSGCASGARMPTRTSPGGSRARATRSRSEEHTSELQSQSKLVCRLLLEKKKLRNPVWNRGW